MVILGFFMLSVVGFGHNFLMVAFGTFMKVTKIGNRTDYF